jgi:hypothetical protein
VFRNTRVLLLHFVTSSNEKSLDVLLKSVQLISKCNFKFTPLYTLSGKIFQTNRKQTPFFSNKSTYKVINYVVFVVILPSMRINL